MIIGLGHKARNGKTTIVEYLKLKYDFHLVNFADALYDECRRAPEYLEVSSSRNSLWLIKSDERNYFHSVTGESIITVPESLKPYLSVIENGMIDKCAPLLQWWGTDFRRKYFGLNYWVQQVYFKISKLAKNDYDLSNIDVAIGDMRFTNEAEFVKKYKGETWKVDREYIDPDRDPNHPSEIDLDNWKFDRVLKNTGTKGDLFRKVDIEMCDIGGRYEQLA